jgi:hypothetical protein
MDCVERASLTIETMYRMSLGLDALITHGTRRTVLKFAVDVSLDIPFL